MLKNGNVGNVRAGIGVLGLLGGLGGTVWVGGAAYGNLSTRIATVERSYVSAPAYEERQKRIEQVLDDIRKRQERMEAVLEEIRSRGRR